MSDGKSGGCIVGIHIFFLLVLFSVPAMGSNAWERVDSGPSGFTALAVHPSDPQTVLAVSANGVYKTTNGGESWTAVNTGMHAHKLVWDSTNPQTVYATRDDVSGGVYKSTDGGTTWRTIDSGVGYFFADLLVIDPTDPQVLYVGGAIPGPPGGTTMMYKSLNGGESWTASSASLPGFQTLAVSPSNPQVLYAGGTGSGGLYRSNNGGATWSALNGLPDSHISIITIDPTNAEALYVVAGLVTYKSTDGGATWAFTNGQAYYALVIDPNDHATLYSGTTSGILKSSDGGATWQSVSVLQDAADARFTEAVTSIAVSPSNSQILYITTYNAILKTENSGGWWTEVGGSLAFKSLLVVDANSPDILYAGSNLGVYKSIDGGRSWRAKRKGMQPSSVESLAIDPRDSQILYAGTAYAFFISTDGGESWNKLSNGLPSKGAFAITIDPMTTKTVYVAIGSWSACQGWCSGFPWYEGAGVYKSNDGGDSWYAINSGLTDLRVSSLAVDPRNPQIIFAGTYSGPFRSSNGAESWNPANSGMGAVAASTIVIDPLDSATLYAGTGDALYKSTDGGSSWNRAWSSTGVLVGGPTSLVIDPANPQVLFAAAHTVYESVNAAASWSQADEGLQTVYHLALDASGHNLYAAANGAIFRRSSAPDKPTIWSLFNNVLRLGSPFSMTLQGDYVASFAITGDIPPGLTFDAASGTLSGIPTTIGSYSDIIASATNIAGSTQMDPITLSVISLPGAPRNVKATAGNGGVGISFDPPDSDGGGSIISYTVTSNFATFSWSSSSSPIVITNLPSYLACTFKVAAVTPTGAGTAATAVNYNELQVSLQGNGSGAVHSTPAGISCVTGSCYHQFAPISPVNQVTLIPTPSAGSRFVGWSGACAGPDICTVSMAPLHQKATAQFDILHNARIVGNSKYYGLLQSAYNDAASGAVIQAQGMRFAEALRFDKPREVRLYGGFDAAFAKGHGITTVEGSLTVRAGRVVVDGLAIK